MNVNDAFPSNYLKASDLQGKAVPVTISHVTPEAIGRDKEMKPVLYFKGKTKGVVLNKTNARNITNLLGTAETDEWTGQVIAIYPTTTEFAGETVECIRVKAAPVPRPAAPPPPPPPSELVSELDADEIPF